MTKRVDAFQQLVLETKRASTLLLQEQEKVGVEVEGMEKKFVRVQADLVRCNAIKKKIQQQQSVSGQQFRKTKGLVDEAQEHLDLERRENILIKRKCKELEVALCIEQSRSERLQKDFDSTQALLVESTSTSAELKHALEDCKQAFARV